MSDASLEAAPADTQRERMLAFTTQIVSAHVANNTVPAEQLPGLIQQIFQAITGLGAEAPPEPKLEPAVPIKKSVFPDYIVCLEDGKKLKMLKRHLQTAYGMTPEQYRERWSLPSSYPMVAPNYAEKRSSLARSTGLGRKPGSRPAEPAAESAAAPPAAPARSRRSAKAEAAS